MVRPHALLRLPRRPSPFQGMRTYGLQAIDFQICIRNRSLWTLGIETSCDDTCVSVLRIHEGKASLAYKARVPCSTKTYEGIHPLEAVESHTRNLPKLIHEALQYTGLEYGHRFVPLSTARQGNSRLDAPTQLRRPDLIAVTRGPGMKTCLSVGISMAKALSIALSVPLIGVHHMQAHALTPQMETAFRRGCGNHADLGPQYPFLTLLVSGGHTMLVHTTSNIDHRILASTSRGRVDPKEKASPIAIGDMLDKCARAILPDNFIPPNQESVVYAKLMETFAYGSKYNGMMHYFYNAPQKRQDEIEIYQSESGWVLPPPLRLSREMKYDFSGLGGMTRSIMQKKPDMSRDERAELAYHTMRLAFEHLASRVILALQEDEKLLANPPKHLVISGGVASNQFLRRVLEAVLKARGFGDIKVIAPGALWCTDNAAMIAWTGAEMYQSGWTTDHAFLPKSEWPIEQIITGTDCWIRRDVVPPLGTGKDAAEQKDELSERSRPIEAPGSARAEPQPDISLNVLADHNSSGDQSSAVGAKPADTKKVRRQKRRAKREASSADASTAFKQTKVKISPEEQLQYIQERVQRLLHPDRGQKVMVKDDTPPLELDQPGSSSVPSQPRPEIVETPKEHVQSAQVEPVTAKGRSGDDLVRQVPSGRRPASRTDHALKAPQTPQQQTYGVGGGGGRKTDRSHGMTSEQMTARQGSSGRRRGTRSDYALKAFQAPQQQTVGVGGGRKTDRSRDMTSEQTTAPRPTTDKSGKGSGQKTHMVRLLRPLQPQIEENPPSTPSTPTGSLRKGLGALKKWVGL